MSKRESQRKQENIQINENENTICQILWDSAKAVLKGKFTVLNAYIRKEQRSQKIEVLTSGTEKKRSKINFKKAEGRE